jgi:hypothetical protein
MAIVRRRRRGLGSIGDVISDAEDAIGIGVAVATGNPAAAAPAVQNIMGQFTGGNSTDQARLARCQWFLTQASLGNVGAAQCLLGGQNTVASNELPYYNAAISSLQSTAFGAEVWQAAVAAGPYWSLSDSATSYPQMTAYVNKSVVLKVPPAAATSTATSGSGMSGGTTMLLLAGIAGVGVYFLTRARRT